MSVNSVFKKVTVEQIEEAFALAMKNLLGTDKDIRCSINSVEYGQWGDSISLSSISLAQKSEDIFSSDTESKDKLF